MKRIGVITLVVGSLACGDKPPLPVDTVAATPQVDTTSAAPSAPYVFINDYGIGDLRAGMTLEEAARVADGIKLVAGADSTGCSYLEWPSAPAGVLVMFDAGRVARIDIDSSGVRTEAGAQVGDSETKIDSVYAGRVNTMPHKYTAGHYKVVTPMHVADSTYRLIFETENGKVTRYRVGRRPQVEYVEGCS